MPESDRPTDHESRYPHDPALRRKLEFGCCGPEIETPLRNDRCSRLMRRHPILAAILCGWMAILLLVVAAGAVLGTIAFLRAM